MPLELISMRGTGAGGAENGVANVDVPEDGQIVGIQWAMNANLNAIGEFALVEISFIQTLQEATNDSRGIITIIRSELEVVTSGGGNVAVNLFVPFGGGGLDVQGGERLFMNMSASAGVVTNANAVIHLNTRRGAPRRSRRR